MWLLVLGVVGVALKYFEISRVGLWSWWVVLTPFPLTIAWWAFADASGYTRRKVMKKEALRKQQRIEQQRGNLGLLPDHAPPESKDKH